jgi:glutaredoxin
MKQQCFLWSVWLTWLALPIIALLALLVIGWPAALAAIVAGVTWQVFYLRFFPRLSNAMGYGSVADVAADLSAVAPGPTQVTLFTASLCPFCPLVRTRLRNLQRQLAFQLTEVDVTLRPDVVKSKNLRAVPVVEVDGRFWVGNGTSSELLAFLTHPQAAPERSSSRQ